MTDVATLAKSMQLGKFPDWGELATMRNGDRLVELVDAEADFEELSADVWEAAKQMAGPEALQLSPASALSVILARFDANKATADGLRETLVTFGALDADDDETDALALLRILLPPTG